jgi:DNA-binding winged helix-turn-helix (wHTH) protein/Tfp pilus assembly protein PilF
MGQALQGRPQERVNNFFDRQKSMSIYAFGSFQLDGEARLLMRDGRPVDLSPKVAETLLALVERPGELLTKSVLMDRIWPGGFVEESNLTQNIHVLRKALRQFGSAGFIETVPNRGYRFIASVRELKQLAPVKAGNEALRRFAAAFAGIALAATSLVLFASYGFGRPAALHGNLSEKGARFYKIGQYYWNLRTREGVRESLVYFARVVDSDPGSARGYAALADANATMGDYCYGMHRPSVYFARAAHYAQTALLFDPNSSEAHAALGFLALERRDTDAATVELRRAIALDASYGPAQEWYGVALVRGGHLAEGFAQLKTAANLDPLSVSTIAWLGETAYRQGRAGDAIAYSQEALELSPRRSDVLKTIGLAYEAQGDVNGAIDAFKRYGGVSQYYRASAATLLAHAYTLVHRIPEARAQLDYARAHTRQLHGHGAATFG